MYNYEINGLECQVNLPIEYDNYLLGCVLKFLKVGNQKVIAKVFIKNNATGKEFYVYDYSMYNTTALTFISFVKSVIPSIIDNIIQEQEYIIDFVSVLEMQGLVKKLEKQEIELEVSNSDGLYNAIYADMKDMCKDLNIDSQILSARDKEILNNAVEENEEKMLNAEADFDPDFEILRNKLSEISNRDITAKVEIEVVEEEEDENPDVYKVAKRMNKIEESVENSKKEFGSGQEYFLLNQMSEYMWKYMKSVNSRFPNPEFFGVCDYYLNTQNVFDPEARSFMIQYCINKSKMK